MKVAKVRYTEGARVRTFTGPTGQKYTFKHYTEGKHYASVEEVEDALFFDDRDSFVVSWTPAGLIARATHGSIESAKEVLSSLDYRQKQKLAKDRGIKANQSEEELEEELQKAVEQLAERAEH